MPEPMPFTPIEPLPPPDGSFERVLRRAQVWRAAKAAVVGLSAVAVLAAMPFLLRPGGSEVVTAADDGSTTAAPSTSVVDSEFARQRCSNSSYEGAIVAAYEATVADVIAWQGATTLGVNSNLDALEDSEEVAVCYLYDPAGYAAPNVPGGPPYDTVCVVETGEESILLTAGRRSTLTPERPSPPGS